MARAMHRCKCGELTRGRCPTCQRTTDQKRGSFRQRGYGNTHDTRFKQGVLQRDPTCVCTQTNHGHATPCGKPSRHADHHPLDRRELVAQGLDPDDPKHGRGLCHSCHSSETALLQPGGWNQKL